MNKWSKVCQVAFFCSRCFKFWLLSELQDLGKESQDNNTNEAIIINFKITIDQKNQLQLMFNLLGGFIRCTENLRIIGWSIGIQFIWYTAHQTWRSAYVGIKMKPTINWLMILLMKDWQTLIFTSFFVTYIMTSKIGGYSALAYDFGLGVNRYCFIIRGHVISFFLGKNSPFWNFEAFYSQNSYTWFRIMQKHSSKSIANWKRTSKC